MTPRHAGAMAPLFSLRSSKSWGIGDIADLPLFAPWLSAAGFDRLMLLPINTVGGGETSPYAAASTMAIDPIYIALRAVPDFVYAGGVDALSADARVALAIADRSSAIHYDAVRRAKREALSIAFAQFADDEWAQLTTRGAALAAYIARERWWLDDYALFMAIADTTLATSWRQWPEAIRRRDPRALDELRRQLSREVLRHQYLQWIADSQWQAARVETAALGVALMGDLPFVARTDSADVWARSDEFFLDVSAGVPPDTFSDTGQDWGLPTYHWAAIAATDYAWMRQRARRMADLFDGIRIDHLVGLYRTFGRPPEGEPFFNPDTEAAQTSQGEILLGIFRDTGAALVAEDLGTVPDFVRLSLARAGVPGSKILRWERHYDLPDQPFIEPTQYPASSAAMTGTHDTEPMATWWDTLGLADRAQVLALDACSTRGLDDPLMSWTDGLRDALIGATFQSASADIFLPIQDLFSWRDRINTPGTVGAHNWTWMLPWAVDQWMGLPETRARAEELRALAAASRRVAHGR
jgi:4-alpha-glucanotransferase